MDSHEVFRMVGLGTRNDCLDFGSNLDSDLDPGIFLKICYHYEIKLGGLLAE